MQARKFEMHGCVALIPKAAHTGFEEARGEFLAHSIGRHEMSRKCRATRIWPRRAGTARCNRAEAIVSGSGSNQFGEAAGRRRAKH